MTGALDTGGWKQVLDRTLKRLRRRIRRVRLHPERLEPGRWWNGSLRSRDQIQTALARATAAGLPLPRDREGVWACLETLELIVQHSGTDARIADIGLHEYGPLLDWLVLLGYEDVQSERAVRLRANRVLATAGGELEDSGAEPVSGGVGPYDVVVCKNLPGDRIPLGTRLDQAGELLRPGGLLILRSEFWDLPLPFQGAARCASDHFCCGHRVEEVGRAAFDRGLIQLSPVFTGGRSAQLHCNLLGVGERPMKLAFRMQGLR